MTLSTIDLVLILREFDNQVGIYVTWRLMTHLLEDKLGTLRKAGLDLDHLLGSLDLSRLCIMLNYVSIVVDVLNGAIIELSKCTVKSFNNVFGLRCFVLIQATKPIAEDALLNIVSFLIATLGNEVCILQLLLKVSIWVHFHEVSASDFH